MTEEEARERCALIAGPALPDIERYADALLEENATQNLISRSTEATIWRRHLLDSLQLAQFARATDRTWIDVGSGAGLPGLVLATLGRWRVTLVEPRRRRADFLERMIAQLQLNGVTLVRTDVRAVSAIHDVVSARAVASVSEVLELTHACTDFHSRFVLPKGRSAVGDMDLARQRWHGTFHVEQSLTDAEAGIVIVDAVRPR